MRNLTFLLGLLSLNSLVWGNPENPMVTAGAATFSSPNVKTLNVTAADKTIISWDNFSIDSSETTVFMLPDKQSAVLNRVSSSFPSTLAGRLQSNGEVYLINPNGILITEDGMINTAAFLASTLDVTDHQFLSGGDLAFTGDSAASIVMRGRITTWNGDLVLLSHNIVNMGHMEALNGVVALGAGSKIYLSESGDQRIAVEISSREIKEGIGIDHQGIIDAVQAELKADGNLYALAIQNDGVVNATSTLVKQGRIFLVAPKGVTSVDGVLSAKGNGCPGGEIQVLGESVVLNNIATIDASGTHGGGTVYIGGGKQGRNPDILNAEGVFVNPLAKIFAEATQEGDGGTVIFWSNANTSVYGSTFLKGGPAGGDGGFIEVSSGGYLSYEGIDDRSSPLGNPGTLLLDPTTITINAAGPNTNINFGPASCAANTFCGSANTATIMISNGSTGLLDRLALGPVIVDSSAGTGGASAAAATITISSPITVSVNNPLTFNSSSGINVNAAVTNSGTSTITFNSATAANGTITFTAGLSNTSSGNIVVNSATTSGRTGDIAFNAGSSISNSSTGNITLSAGTVANGNFSTAAGVGISNTGNGNITIQAGSATSTGSVTTNATSTISNNGVSGTFTITSKVAGTSMSLGGPIAASSSGAFQITASQGNIGSAATATMNFTGGAPVTIQSTLGTITLAGTTQSFSGGAGPLTINGQTALTLNGPISLSYTGTSLITSPAGTVTLANVTNSGSGTLNLTGGVTSTGNVAFSAGATLTNSSSGTVNLTAGNTGNATTGSITFTATSPISNSGTGSITMNGRSVAAGTAVSLLGSITASSPGAFTVTATQGSINTASTSVMNFTGGAPVTFQALAASGGFTMAGNPMNFSGGTGPLIISGIGVSSITGPINLSYTGTSSITVSNGTLTISSTFTNSAAGTLNVAAGTLANGNITFNAGSGFTNSGNGAINLTTGSAGTTGTITTSTTSTITNSGTSGTISIIGQGTSAGSGLNIQGPIVSSSTGVFLMKATQGAISTAATTTMNFSVGAPVTIQTTGTGGSLSLTGSSMAFTGPGGSLTVSGNNAVSINGPITYSFTGLAQFSSVLSNITTNASGNMTFNSGAGNVSFSTPVGSITTNAGATLLFNAGAGNLSMAAGTNPTNAGTLTNNSTLTFNSGAGNTVTMTAFGAIIVGNINNGSTGLFQMTASGPSGSIATNSATALNWGPGGLSAGNLQMNAATSITTTGTISFSATSGVSSPALSMTAGTNVSINGVVTYTSPFNWTITNTNGIISNGASAPITLNSGAGSFIVSASVASGTSISLQAPVISHTSSAATLTANTGNITSTAAAVFTFDNGAPVTIQTLASGASITWASGSVGTPSTFSGGVGPLTISAVGTLALNGSTVYSDSGPLTLTSTTGSVTTSATGNLTENSGGGNVSITAPAGSVTFNAATLLLFNAGAGNLTITAGTNPTNAGSITAPGTITFNSGMSKALTMTAFGAITLNTINYGSTGTAMITAQNGAISLATGTTLNWGPGGLSAGNLVLNASTSITTTGNIVFSATSGTSSPALSMLAGTNMTISGSANTYASPFSWTAQNTQGLISTGSSSNILFSSGAGPFLVTANNLNTSTAITLAGVITSPSTSLLQFIATSGSISTGSTSTLTANNGAPVTLQANTLANQTISLGGTFNLSGGTGPLQVLATSTINVNAALNYSDSLPAVITSSAGAISTANILNIGGAGGLSITANGNVTMNANVIYTSTGNFSILSSTGVIIVAGPISMNTPATLFMTTSSSSAGDISIRNLVRNSGAGPMVVNCGRDFLLGEEEVIVSCQFGSAGGDLTFNIGRDLVLHAYGELGNSTYAQIGYHTGNINSNIIFNTIGRNVNVYAGWFPLTYAIIGHGSQQPGATGGTRNGNIIFGSAMNPIPGSVYVAAYDMSSDFGTNSSSFAQIGHTRSLSGTPVTATGDIDLGFVNGSVTVLGENSLGAYALIGHGGASSPQSDSFSGTVRVNAVGPISIQGGSFTGAFAGIGHMAILNAPGTVTLQSDLIQVVSSDQILLQTGSSAEAVIGLYVKATAVGGAGAISATTSMTVPQITVSSTNDLIVGGAIPSDAFNGVLIGALAYTGAIPFVPAGNVGCNITITSLNDLQIYSGLGGNSANTFAYITNGIGTPMGTFDVDLNITGGLSLLSGNNTAAINSLGTLEITAGGPYQGNSDVGQALISSIGNLTFSSSAITMNGMHSATSAIQTTTGSLSITSGLTELIFNAAITSGGTLTMALSDDLFISDTVTISSTGAYTISGSGRAFLAAAGNVIITGSSTGSLSVVDDLYLLSDTLGSAQITASGNLNVSSSSGSIYLVNFTGQTTAISSTAGSLSVTANNSCSLLEGAQIAVSGGTASLSVTATTGNLLVDIGSNISNLGTGAATVAGGSVDINGASSVISTGSILNPLTVNATTGNLTLGNGSLIQNLGTGGVSSTVSGALNLNGGPTGGSSILSGAGGAVINAGYLNMIGFSPLSMATISSSAGGLSITTTAAITVSPYSAITLATAGGYLVSAGTNLVVSGSNLQNTGLGTTTVMAGGAVNFLEGATLQGASAEVVVSSTLGGIIFADAASVTTVGKLTVTSMRDILLSNATMKSTLAIGGSTLTVSAADTLNVLNSSSIVAQGGAGALSVSTNNGVLNLNNGASIHHLGSGSVTVNVGDAALIRGGQNGDAFISGNSTMTVIASQALVIESVGISKGYLSSAGTTLIAAGRVEIVGISSTFPASILNSAGDLSISSGNMSISDFAQVKLTAGSGVLTVDTTVGDLRIANASVIQNQGTGALNSAVAGTLLIEGGPLGAASMLGNTGGATISADVVSLKGFTGAFNAVISVAKGAFTLSSTHSTNLDSHAKIALTTSSAMDSLTLMIGEDLFVGNDSIIQNLGTASPTMIFVTGSANFLSGAGNAVLQGNSGALSLSATDSIHFVSDLTGASFVTATGSVSISSMADILLEGSSGSANASSITSSSGAMTINAMNNLTIRDRANITLSAGSSLLTVNAGGDLSLENGAAVAQKGTGNFSSTIGGNLLVRGGPIGSSSITCNGTMGINVTDEINLEAVSGAQALLSSQGATTINATRITHSGFDATNTALIKNASGSLTVTAETINLINFGQIKLTAGSGILTVNTTDGDLRLTNGSVISNSGTGTTSCTVNNTLYIEGGVLSGASFTTNGGMTLSAQDILMTGFSSNNRATLSAAQGNLHVSSTLTTSLNPFAMLILVGGSGALNLMVGSDLFLANGSSIQCGGTATASIQASGTAMLLGGAGDSFIKGNTGLLSVMVGDNLRIASDINGKAFITSNGAVIVSSGGDISILGAFEASLPASIQTTASSLSVTAAKSMLLYDTANISVTAGTGALNVNTTTGDLYVENGAFIQNNGTGALNSSIGKNAVVKSGLAGSSFLSSNGVLSFTVTGDLNVEASSNAVSRLFCKGNSSISASRIFMNGFSASFPAYIEDTTGSLSVTGGSINLLNFATIKLDAGASTLTVNATSSNFRIDNGSIVQHLGTGTINSTTAGTLYILGSAAASALAGGSGGATVTAGAILMSGASTVLTGAITAAQGALSVTSMGMLSLTPFSKINLNGGSGNLTVHVSSTLYEVDATQIRNFGTGMTTITSGMTVICH